MTTPVIATATPETATEARPHRRRALPVRYIVERLLGAIFALWGVITLVFFMILATGSPATLLVGAAGTREDLDNVNKLYGFDQPLWVQYWRFLSNTVTGNFPDSIRFNNSPMTYLVPAIQLTVILAVVALVIGVAVGLAIGYYTAFGKKKWIKAPLYTLTMIFQATPTFVVGLLLVLAFALNWKLLPTQGATTPQHIILPALTLSLLIAPPVARLFRANLVQQSGADHLPTALLKDISLKQIRRRHIALNALPPVAVLVGLQTGSLLGGAVLTETIFAWPGLGTVVVNAVDNKDYPVILAGVTIIAAAVVISNLVADLLVRILDPRTAVNS